MGSNPCKNGGTSVGTSNTHTNDVYKCICATGWTGATCSVATKCLNVVCTQPSNPCYYSECNVSDGKCKTVARSKGFECNDGNSLTKNDICEIGGSSLQCVG